MSGITPRIVARLKELCAPERVLTDPENLADYAHDEGPETPHPPDAVVKVVDVHEVSEVMKLAYEEGIPVTPRGLGTGLAGGSVPVEGGIVMSLELMNKVLEVDPENMMARTQPGVITARFQDACALHNLYYPVDPASLEECSIGGNVATNAGGARAYRYGVTGDYLCGVQAVLPNGTVFTYGGKVRKNATGYDLCALLVGTEGTLGVLTELTFRLIPKPRFTLDLLIPFENLRAGVELVVQLAHERRFVPAVIEFIEKKGIAACAQVFDEALPFPDAAVQVLVEVEGNEQEAVFDEAFEVARLAQALGAGEPIIADNPASQARLWKTRRALARTLKQVYAQVYAEDIVVPLSRIPETVEFITQLESRYRTVIVPFGHIGDGNIHVDICRTDQPAQVWVETCDRIVDELVEFVLGVGGQITAEHGVGSLKRRLVKRGLGPEALQVMRKVKQALDPKNLLNPGKIFP